MIQPPYTIRLTLKFPTLILGILIFGAGAIMAADSALNDPRGIIFNGIITISPSLATIFYWILSVVSGLMGLLAVMVIVQHFRNPQIITVLSEKVLLPPPSPFSKTIEEYPYSQITELQEVTTQGQKYLYVHFSGGKRMLGESRMPKGEYEKLKQYLFSRVSAPPIL